MYVCNVYVASTSSMLFYATYYKSSYEMVYEMKWMNEFM